MAIKKRSIVNNYIFNLVYSVLAIIVPIITTPYISRVFDATGIGDFNYTSAVETYFVLFAVLGTTAYAKREIAFRQNNLIERDKLFKEIVVLRTVLASVVSVVYLIMALNSEMYSSLFLAQIFGLVAVAFDISWFFQGMEDFQAVAIRDMVVKIISVVMIFIFVKSKSDVWIYALINSLAILLSALYMWRYISKSQIAIKISFKNCLSHILPSLRLFIPVVAISVYTVIDKIMLKNFCDSAAVGYYSLAERIVRLALTIITALGAVTLPRIAFLYSQEKHDDIKTQLFSSIRFVLCMATPMMFGTIAVADVFVPIFFGEGYADVIQLLRILSVLFIFIGMSGSVGGPLLVPLKRENSYTISVIAGAIINVIMNLLLIPSCQALGASIGTVIAEFSVMAISLFCCRDYINMKSIMKVFFKYSLYSIVILITVFLAKNLFVQPILSLIASVFIGITVYVTLLFVTKDAMFEFAVEVIKKRILKKNAT